MGTEWKSKIFDADSGLRLAEGLEEHAACLQAAQKPTSAKSGFFKGASVPREYKTRSSAPLSNSGIPQYICAEEVLLAMREEYKLYCKQTLFCWIFYPHHLPKAEIKNPALNFQAWICSQVAVAVTVDH